MLTWAFIFLLFISVFIPQVREFIKRKLHILFFLLGGLLTILSLIYLILMVFNLGFSIHTLPFLISAFILGVLFILLGTRLQNLLIKNIIIFYIMLLVWFIFLVVTVSLGSLLVLLPAVYILGGSGAAL